MTVLTTAANHLSHEVQDFLTFEANLLDRWQLQEWLDLFGANGRWLMPACDRPEGDPRADTFLVCDDRFLLEHRVAGLLSKNAHAEYPHSRTRRLVANVRAVEGDDELIRARANFAVYRIKARDTKCFVGEYRHLLQRDSDGGLRFLERRTVLDLDWLGDGAVTFIL